MKKITACIFDLDGVIVDTAKFHYQAWKELANELGFDFTKEDNEKLKGVSRMKSLDILLEIGSLKICDDIKEQLAAKKNNRYIELISTLSPKDILPGVNDFLKDIKSKNIKIALGSASKNAMTILKNLNLVDIFDAIIDGNKVSMAKPNPEVFLKAAQELNAEPNKSIVFEDAQAGIIAAKNAGMFAVGVGKPENLKGADFYINNFKNIKLDDIINNL
jgi:beta-phosphoglucomutase